MGLFGSSSSTKNAFPWTRLTTMEQLDELIAKSAEVPVLIFKHSTTCGISAMVIGRFESKWTTDQSECICVYLDLLGYRQISNAVAQKTGVVHQSPQAILLKNGQVVYDESHGSIDAAHIQTLL